MISDVLNIFIEIKTSDVYPPHTVHIGHSETLFGLLRIDDV